MYWYIFHTPKVIFRDQVVTFFGQKMRPFRKLKVIELEEDEKEDEGAAKV